MTFGPEQPNYVSVRVSTWIDHRDFIERARSRAGVEPDHVTFEFTWNLDPGPVPLDALADAAAAFLAERFPNRQLHVVVQRHTYRKPK